MLEKTYGKPHKASKKLPKEGLGRFVAEFAKPDAIAPEDGDKKEKVPISVKQGVKRGRDGSPKAADAEAEQVLVNPHSSPITPGISYGNKVQTINGHGRESPVTTSTRISSPKTNDRVNGTKSGGSSKSNTGKGPDKTYAGNGKTGKLANGRGKALADTSGNTSDASTHSDLPKVSNVGLDRVAKALLKTRKSLPIWAHQADIRWSLRKKDVLLLVGETGSGKSTQVPQFLMTEPWFRKRLVKVEDESGNEKEVQIGGMIAITEPRKVAATSLARRVASEVGSHVGRKSQDSTVGYSIRFDRNVSRNTKIKFMTEGMLLQEIVQDPYLRKYSVVVVDEIHERSVDVDLLVGFLKKIVSGNRKGRGGVPLKVVIMSATADMESLQQFWSDAQESSTDETETSRFSKPSPIVNGHGNGKTNIISANGTHDANGVDVTSARSGTPASRRASTSSFSSWGGFSGDETDEKNTPGGSPSEIPERGIARPVDVALNKDIDGVDGIVPSSISKDDIAIHHIEGRQHPVTIYYSPEPVTDYLEAMLKTIFKIHTTEPLPGDILAFLTGKDEIENLKKLVEINAAKLTKEMPRIKIVTLYAALSQEEQQEAFQAVKEKRTRKVVIATNIAETSITVPGVRYVIDCGKAKIKQYRARLGLESLLAKPISKSSAMQRKGRAGREAPGKCYRLYTEAEYLNLPSADIPEILRTDIVQAVLTMKARGVDDVLSFPLMSPPDVDSMERSLNQLFLLGALEENGRLSEVGRTMARFPLSPALGRVIVGAAEPDADCVLEVLDIIAILTTDNNIYILHDSEEKREETFEARKELTRREGDLLTYLTTVQKYSAENTNRNTWCEKHFISSQGMKRAMDIRKQLRNECTRLKLLTSDVPADPQPYVALSPERAELVLKCFLKAFATKTAALHPDGSYRTTSGKHVIAIHPASVLYGKKTEAIMYYEHVFTQRNYAKSVSAVQMNWIGDVLAPEQE